MKINIIPTNKLAMLSAAVCAVMLAFTHNASADATLTNWDNNQAHVGPYQVGTLSPANPADPTTIASYINFMIKHAAGGPYTFGNETMFRTSNFQPPGTLPLATAVGTVSGGGTTINLGPLGGFTYLFAKYDGQNDYSQVWYIAGITGTITIPAFGPGGYGLSGWILFGPTGGGVPDGGTTVMLLGAALGALGMARRYLMS